MSSTKTKSSEVIAPKKLLSKKKSDTLVKPAEASKTPKKEAPTKEVKDTKEKPKKAPKKEVPVKEEKVKKTSKKGVAEKTDEVPVVKKVKKINIEPTLALLSGLNLSPAKVKTILDTHCINKEASAVEYEMENARVMHECAEEVVSTEPLVKKPKEFTFELSDLSEKSLKYLDACYVVKLDEEYDTYTKASIKDFDKKKRAEFDTAKHDALVEFERVQKMTKLFNQDSFDLKAFCLSYDPKFYKNMTHANADWKLLKNEKLYGFCNSLVIKMRFNGDTRIFITAFVEYIIKQLVINGTTNCIKSGKKIIQPEHALNDIAHEFTLFPFINTSNVYKNYLHAEESAGEDDEEDDEEASNADQDANPKKMPQFVYYVGEMCRQVRMDLSESDSDEDDALKSKFNQTSVSKRFKQFCSDVIIELLKTFGDFLKCEVITRNKKTINYESVTALVHNTHTMLRLDSAETIKFIQEKYNMHNEYTSNRPSAKKQ